MEDKEIVEMFLSRDENAIRHTERKYSRYLLTIARNILSDNEDSRECVNDTYLKAWNTIPPNQPEKLSYYLGNITRQISVDRLRSRLAKKRAGGEYALSLEELEECVSKGGDASEYADVRLLSELIGRYLRSCSEQARQIFVCRYYFCDSLQKIAEYFGFSQSKVKSILFRTRAGLKEFLIKEGYEL